MPQDLANSSESDKGKGVVLRLPNPKHPAPWERPSPELMAAGRCAAFEMNFRQRCEAEDFPYWDERMPATPEMVIAALVVTLLRVPADKVDSFNFEAGDNQWTDHLLDMIEDIQTVVRTGDVDGAIRVASTFQPYPEKGRK